MIDINQLSKTDRDLILAYANAMRDIDTFALLAKPMTRVGSSMKKKIWKRFTKQADKPITESLRVLEQLTNYSNTELRQSAKKCIGNDSGAMKELRQLGNLIKQFETPAASGRKEWTSSQSDPLNQ